MDVEAGTPNESANVPSNHLQSLETGDVSLRVTSASRFLNRNGTSSASLPGERRIIRRLFADLQGEFGASSVTVHYKPAHIRLGSRVGLGRAQQKQRGREFGVVLVARITAAPLATVLGWIGRWGVDQQFSGGFRSPTGGSGAPASSTPLSDGSGVLLRGGTRGTREVVVRAKWRRSGSAAFEAQAEHRPVGQRQLRGVAAMEGGRQGDGGDGDDGKLVLVTVLTNAPDDTGVARLLERLAKDMLVCFLETRIHYPR